MRRHVRLRAVGPAGAHPQPGPRPVRREAALLWLGRPRSSSSAPSSRRCAAHPRLRRARSTGARCACSRPAPTFRRRCRSTSGVFKLDARLHPDDLPRCGGDAARRAAARRVAPAASARALLVLPRRRSRRARPSRSRMRRRRWTSSSGPWRRRSPASRWPTFRSAPSCRAASTARRSARSTRNIRRVPVRTFSIGFEEAGFNEAEYAKAVARASRHGPPRALRHGREARDVIPLLPTMYDEPFADSSQIPTHLVSRFAREQVTVALTGDGGDELFAGYNRHFAAPRLWQQLQRAAAAGARRDRIAAQPASVAASGAAWRAASGRRQPHFGGKVQKALRDRRRRRAASTTSIRASSTNGASSLRRSLGGGGEPPASTSIWRRALRHGADDVLRRGQLSARRHPRARSTAPRWRWPRNPGPVPRPPRGRARGAHPAGTSRCAAARASTSFASCSTGLVPRALFDRPKAGFGVPVGEWIKGPLARWAEDLLDPDLLRNRGLVRRRHGPLAAGRSILSGQRDSTPALWAILMFQSWLAAECDDAAAQLGEPAPSGAKALSA